MNYLYSMFKGSGSKAEVSNYDKITFKVNLSEHIPQYYQSHSNKPIIEQQITPSHPLYSELFPDQQTEATGNNQHRMSDKDIEQFEKQLMSPTSKSTIKYTVKNNDTMFGLAIRLDISQKYLREINNISGNLYPGMVIKLPKDVDLSLLQQQQYQQTKKMRISQLLQTEKTTVNHKFIVYYMAGLKGSIKGSLTINKNYIIFNPLLEQQQNLQKFTIQKLLKFNALIEMCDIEHAQALNLPQMQQFDNDGKPKVKWVVQFMLYRVGDNKIQKKFKQRIKQLKLEHKALASISFSFEDDYERSEQLCHEATAIVNDILRNSEQEAMTAQKVEQVEQKKNLTNIPFFDIIQQSLSSDKAAKKQQNHIIRGSAILGTLTQQSRIITHEHFQNLAKGFPILYKLYNWQLSYSNRRDGSAFCTFLNKTIDIEPAILLIKEYKGNILGAFLVDSIEAGKTGRGQMFIFTFRGDQTVPEIYEWTTKNQFFVNLDKQAGLGIGMGIKYGIFIDKTFEKGSSASTNTFGNKQRLSKKEDFLIDDIQIWGVDSSF